MLSVIASCNEPPSKVPSAKIEKKTTAAEKTTPPPQNPRSGQQLDLSIHDVPRESAVTSFDKINRLPDFFKQEKEKKMSIGGKILRDETNPDAMDPTAVNGAEISIRVSTP